MKNSDNIKLSAMLLTILLLITSCNCLKTSTEPTNPPDENTLTISPDGGEYNFPSGIRLRVPAGAVEDDTDISLKVLSRIELQPVLNEYGFKEEDLLVYIEGKPAGLTFNTPVELILSSDIEDGDIPLLYNVKKDTTCSISSNSKIKFNSKHNELIISVSHFSSFFAQIVTSLRDLFNIECLTDPCRCGDTKIIQGDKDYLCSIGDCQITETKVTVIFPECGTKEESIMREISPGCDPKLVLSADSYIVPTGGQTNIMANIKLGCAPQSGLNIDFSKTVTNLATLNPVSDNTNSDGSVQTTFTAGDTEGIVSVRAWSTISYYSSTLSANAGGIKEINHGSYISKQLLETIDIQIKDPVESWSGTMTYNTWYDWYSIGFIQTSEYQIDFQFFVYKDDGHSPWNIYGTATSTQVVNLVSTFEDYYVEELNAPSSLKFDIRGYAREHNDPLNIVFYVHPMSLTPAFDCILCFDRPEERRKHCWKRDGDTWLGICSNPYSLGTCSGNVFLQEGTYTAVSEHFVGVSHNPELWKRNTYTIT